jgi:1,4-alpha-glucan branching enzyme
MYAHPGKKLLFMGNEIAQWNEWDHEQMLDWQLLDHGPHKGVQNLVRDLNRVYREEPALHMTDFHASGFEWIDFGNWAESVIVFMRRTRKQEEDILVALNFTPVPRYGYRIGVSTSGFWQEVLNSDAQEYGGSGHGNFGGIKASKQYYHGRRASIEITLPPLAAVFFKVKKAAPDED